MPLRIRRGTIADRTTIKPVQGEPIYTTDTNGITGVSAMLGTGTPGVVVSQARSSYPDLKAGYRWSNSVPFQVSTFPAPTCGTVIDFVLTLDTASHVMICHNKCFEAGTNSIALEDVVHFTVIGNELLDAGAARPVGCRRGQLLERV